MKNSLFLILLLIFLALPVKVLATDVLDLRSAISYFVSIFSLNEVIKNYGQTVTAPTPTPPPSGNSEWTQDAHDAQRTGYTDEEPNEPWTYAWSWNGPDTNGQDGGNFYNGPLHDGRSVTGGTNVYVPAADNGLYALAKSDGHQVWHFTASAVDATPAYDPISENLFVAGRNGTVYKLNGASGSLQGSVNVGSQINKPVLLAGQNIYVVTVAGNLHKISVPSMSQIWVYSGSSEATIPPAYSASRDLLVYATSDLNVHAVKNIDGSRAWRVKPTSHTTADHCGLYNYDYRWPVIADRHGIVFIRLRNPWDGTTYGTTNSAIRTVLSTHPESQSLFALNLSDGSSAFLPAVAPSGADHRPVCGSGGDLFHSISSAPVVRTVEDKEVAYIIWRNSQAPFDSRWDAFMGEMVLDNSTVPGLSAGDLRFIDFKSQIATNIVSDEVHTISMAGNTLFHHHICSVDIYTITNRSNNLGFGINTPITSDRKPPIVRQVVSGGGNHYSYGGVLGCEGARGYSGPAFWIYQGSLSKDMLGNYLINGAGSEEGSPTRYVYVSGGLIITQGPRGDLFVLKHN